MRVSNASGRPIPRPKRWDGECCPHCQVKRAFDAKGMEAANQLAVELRLEDGRTNRAFAGRGLRGERPTEEPPKPRPTDAETRALKARVKEVSLAHPDWSAAKVAEEVGINDRTAARYRTELGLSRQPGPTDEQRGQVRRILFLEPTRSDEEVAEVVGVKTFTVTEVRRKNGIPCHRTRIREDRERRVAEVAAEHPGWGYKRVAATLDLPLNSTRRALEKFRESDPAEPVPAAA
jgi:AraC-like DNA-binding protein